MRFAILICKFFYLLFIIKFWGEVCDQNRYDHDTINVGAVYAEKQTQTNKQTKALFAYLP